MFGDSTSFAVETYNDVSHSCSELVGLSNSIPLSTYTTCPFKAPNKERIWGFSDEIRRFPSLVCTITSSPANAALLIFGNSLNKVLTFVFIPKNCQIFCQKSNLITPCHLKAMTAGCLSDPTPSPDPTPNCSEQCRNIPACGILAKNLFECEALPEGTDLGMRKTSACDL